MKLIWVHAALWLGTLLLAALVIWPFFGATAALAALCAGLLALLFGHLRNLKALLEWARQPLGTPVPPGDGLWGHVFSALNRRSRVSQEQRLELSAALSRFREASQALPDGVIILGAGNIIDWLNPGASAHFGIDAGRDLGTPLTNLVRDPDLVANLEGNTFGETLKIRSSRHPGHTLSAQVIPFGDEQKLLISRDITHLERLETMRRDFVANVSHELRTPLTVVTGFLEMLEDYASELSAEDARHYIHLAGEQGGRMRRLVEDLLTLSSLETDTPAADEKVDVDALLAAVKREAEGLSGGRHQIILECGEGATLLGSARELHSAFSNLASNAVRYTPEGGTIRLHWRQTGQGGELSVEDTGIGIDAKHIPRLTERFYRVDKGRSRETGGTGLGLAIVKHVLERHQARLEVESTPGKGSRFTVVLPTRRVERLRGVRTLPAQNPVPGRAAG